MGKRTGKRYLSMLLTAALLLTALLPVSAFADEAEPAAADSVPAAEEVVVEPVIGESGSELAEAADADAEQGDEEPAAITEISDFESFMACLKVLEGYADGYAAENNADAALLMINYIRTGVEKYNDGNWTIMAGEANSAFIAYVAEQDAANGTSAAALRTLNDFTIPNGQTVDFRHMFATLNIAYYKNNEGTADFGGWAGDICDLIEYSYNNGVSAAELEAAASEIRTKYFGVDDDTQHTFGELDLRGDLDAYYIYKTLKQNGGSLSGIFENYFTAGLTDASRAAFFVNNRFPGSTTREKVRTAIAECYGGNSLALALEASRSLSELENIQLLRTACCYVFADWCYENGKDMLVEVDPVDPDPTPTPEPENPYYSVFSSDTTTIVPGVTQTINYALTRDDKQIVYYIATADISRSDVQIFANYHANDPSQGWAMSRVSDQMAAAQTRHSDPDDAEHYIENYNAVVGVNADFYNMTTGEPSGALVMEGVEYHGGGNGTFFAILKDGSAIIGGAGEYASYKEQIQEAVGGSVFLVRGGKSVVDSSTDYYNSRHSRTCVGITAEGKVVLMVLDGRQEPFSAGGSAEELAQIMLDADCVTAINLDGGGSTTFVAKQEGSNTLSVVNRPSDGYERSVSSSLMIVSATPMSTEFDHALITADYDYLTKGASVHLTASGVSATGGTAELPADISWVSADESIGTITADGVFTSVKNGSVEIQLVSGGKVIGRKTLTVVEPDGLKFSKSTVNAIYGKPVYLPLIATYNENPVAVRPDDIKFDLSNDAAGTIEASELGFAFTGSADSGLRNTTVTAKIARDYSISASIKVSMYSENQAIFDFDNSTAGDRTFAWTRDVSNSEQLPTGEDETDRYHVLDASLPMDVTYVFGLDMTTISVPEKIEPLLAMVAGGDISGITAWDLLLQLAERVSPKTEVVVKIQFDTNFNVDVANLTVSNDYFRLTSAELDENNLLTIKCNFVKQSQAIDPDTANPICILSGIKLTIRDDAAWDGDNCLTVSNSGSVGYDIYLGANALYSMSCQASFQQQYGIYPYEEPENTTHPRGGHFYCEEYKAFTDGFVLDNNSWSGWKTINGVAYYFVDNAALKGIHKVPAPNDTNEFYYRFDETTGASCGKVTGLFEKDGARYYAINGVAKSGWWPISDASGASNYYYFSPGTGKALDGEQVIGGYHYTFVDCILTRGDLVSNSKGVKYMWAGQWATQQWTEVDGNKYYFRSSGYAATGSYAFNIEGKNVFYIFDENGVWQVDRSGLYDVGENTYLIENGIVVDYPGLVLIDGSYYYFAYYYNGLMSVAVKNRTYWITKTNGLMPENNYTFDEKGRMVNPPVEPTPAPSEDPTPTPTPEPTPTPDVKNGIVAENGSLYYYKDGKLYYAGLIIIDGSYYYVKTSGEVIHGRSYWISKTNGLLPEKSYTFADDGKMIDPPSTDPTPTPTPEPTPTPDVKNGIVAENGSLYYYKDGKLYYAGLIIIDGSYYYVKTSGEVIHGRSYWISKTNGLLPEKSYTFADDGKMIDPPSTDPTPTPTPEPTPMPDVKNGIVAENGSLYYYKDGKLYYAGLIIIDGSYYYVKTSGEVIHGRSYWISKTNGLLPEKSYTFADDGKMIDPPSTDPTPTPTPEPTPTPDVKNGIVAENGSLYYYKDGKLYYAGLIIIDGSYYYVKTSGEVIHGRSYWISKTNGLLPEKSYTFADDGKMIL